MHAGNSMKRRHLFDHGYPVATATQIAGSHVLLAITHQALRLSKTRIARAYFLLAASEARLPRVTAERWFAR
jgi:hypothetical protein